MNDKKMIIIMCILLCGTLIIIGFFTMGWFANETYKTYKNERILDGVYINANISYEKAKEIVNIEDKKGDWVCINVAYDMPIERAYEVCVHECSHASFSEIFAEKCEKDLNKCKEYLK